jgi:hypothetical protein
VRPQNSRATWFEAQVIEGIRMLIDDLRSDPNKVMIHIWSSQSVFEKCRQGLSTKSFLFSLFLYGETLISFMNKS